MPSDAVGWITELDPRARGLVAAFRHAAAALQDDRDFATAVEDDLACVVGRRRCLNAVPHFHTLMATLGLHARREVRFHVPSCPCLGADEAAFIRLHDRVSVGALAEAEVIALELVEPHAVMTLLHYTSLLAARCPGYTSCEPGGEGARWTPGRAPSDDPVGGRLH